jgi:hypothetical protein
MPDRPMRARTVPGSAMVGATMVCATILAFAIPASS